MSYLNQSHDARRRTTAVSGVVAIHALLAAGLLTGLDIDLPRIVETRLGATNIPLTPPPPPPPTPTPRETEIVESKVTAPLPPIDPLPLDALDDVAVAAPADELTFVVDRGETLDPVRPADPPAPLFQPRGARPTNDPLRWITTDDYPARALRAEAEGIAGYRVIVATSGRPTACEVTRSTGNGQLDDATCAFIMKRARFEAANDQTGAKVVGSYTGRVKWEIPD